MTNSKKFLARAFAGVASVALMPASVAYAQSSDADAQEAQTDDESYYTMRKFLLPRRGVRNLFKTFRFPLPHLVPMTFGR